jgi:hypothetical protein
MYKDLKSWHTGEVRTHELLVSGMDYGYFYSRKFWSWVDVHVSDPKSAKTEEKNRLKGFSVGGECDATVCRENKMAAENFLRLFLGQFRILDKLQKIIQLCAKRREKI